MNFNVEYDINWSFLTDRTNWEQKKAKAIKIGATQFRKYARPYVMWRTGEMSRSADQRSQIDKGLIIYDTEYASYAYNMDASTHHITKDHNPNAQPHWAEPVEQNYMRAIMDTIKREVFS